MEFQELFEGLSALSEMIMDKIFFLMFNLYFFNQSRGMQVDFNFAFHLVLKPDFAYVFSTRATTT
jgi:hypothetical protein